MSGSNDGDDSDVDNVKIISSVPNQDITVSGSVELQDQYETLHPKFNQSCNALVPRYVVDNNYKGVGDIFEKLINEIHF